MVKLIDSWGSDDLIAKIAKLSHGNKSTKSTEQMIEMLIRLGHDSVFEFAGATFLVQTSIVVQRQWMRYRHMSFLERSLRYVKLDEIDTTVDKERFGDINNYLLFSETVEKTFDTYKTLLNNKVPAEVARMILPLGLTTEFYVSANFREWLHFLKHRLDDSAQYEIREEAKQIYYELSKKFPITISTWTHINFKKEVL